MAEFFQKPLGKVVAGLLVLVGISGAVYSLSSMFGSGGLSQIRTQTYVDAKTGTSFSHTMVAGEVPPVMAPSGGRTGYPSELCYWTADGQPKAVPDHVLLNEEKGDPGPTFCPYCHRLVVHHNPPASPGVKAPPTEAEYSQR